MSAHDPSNAHGNESVRFEESDVATAPVVWSVLALAVFTVLFTIVAYFVYWGIAEREQAASPEASPLAETYAAKEPPEPRLQLAPRTDLEVFRAAERKSLSTLAWIDKEAGVVQVPIERAMQMLIAKGLPAREGPVPSTMAPRGVAPSQPGEAAGAPDWTGGWKVSRDMDEDPGHGSAHGGAAGHAAGGAPHGGKEAPAEGGARHEPEAHGH